MRPMDLTVKGLVLVLVGRGSIRAQKEGGEKERERGGVWASFE